MYTPLLRLTAPAPYFTVHNTTTGRCTTSHGYPVRPSLTSTIRVRIVPLKTKLLSRPFWLQLRAAAFGAGLALILLPAVALAHAKLVGSTPSAGSSVSKSPAELRLTFSEKLELAMTRVKLISPDGKEVTLAKPADGGDEGRSVVMAIGSPLAPGTYTVSWQVVGRDGHPVRGKFTFVVTPAAPSTPVPPAG